jgi:hypothetical protein
VAWSVALTAATLAQSTSAWALDCGQRAKVTAREAEGHKAFGAERYSDAIAAYREVHGCTKDPGLLFNLARALRQRAEYVEAVRTMEAFLRESPSLDDEVASAAKQSLREMSLHVTHLTVTSDVAGADVFLGDVKIGETPLERELVVAGHGELRVVSGGQPPFVRRVVLPRGGALRVDAVLAPAAPLPDEGSGGTGPPTWPWIALATGGAGLLVGSITGAVSIAQTSDVEERCDGDACPPSTADDRAEANTWANVSNVAFVVGGVGVAVGVVALVVTSSDEPTGPSVTLAPTGPGAVMRGRF